MLAVPVAVPKPPVVEVASPTRKGTIFVFWTELMPVASAAVVPVSAGAAVRMRMFAAVALAPREAPLTRMEPLPAEWPNEAAVSCAVLDPPATRLKVELPVPVIAPIVSVELVEAASAPL